MLAGSLDYQETLRAVARLAVPAVADWCAVDLAAGRRHRARRGRARGPGADRARARDAGALPARPAHGRRASTACCGTAASELYREIPDEMLEQAARDPEHLEILRSVGLRSAMLAPMTLRDRVLGVISFVSAESGRRFDEHDLALAEDLALRAAAAVENARLYETASAISATLQSSLLPPVLPELPGMEIAAAYQPAGQRPRGRRRLLRRVQHRRGPVVRGDRRRLRQGRRGGGGDRARALHDPRRGGPPPLAERDPALAQRRDDPAVRRRRRALLHDRLRAPGPEPLAGARDRRVRRPSAAARGPRRRRRRGVRDARDAARPGRAPRSPGPLRRAAQRRHARALHRRADRGRRAGARVGRRRSSRRPRARRPAARPRRRSSRLLAAATGAVPTPRDDIALLALRATTRRPTALGDQRLEAARGRPSRARSMAARASGVVDVRRHRDAGGRLVERVEA